jgi:hypothetical protein
MADDMRIKAEVVLELDEQSLKDVSAKVSESLEKGVDEGASKGASSGKSPQPKRSEPQDAATTAGGRGQARTGDADRAEANDARFQRVTDALERVRTAAGAGRDIGQGRISSGIRGAAEATDLATIMRSRSAAAAGARATATGAASSGTAGSTAAGAAAGGAAARGGTAAAGAGGASGGLAAAALNPITLTVAGIAVAVAGTAFAVKKVWDYMNTRLDSLLQRAYASPAAAGLALQEEIRQRRRDFAIGQNTAATSGPIAALRNDLRDQLARIQVLLTNVVNSVGFKYVFRIVRAIEAILNIIGVPKLESAGNFNQAFSQAINDIVHRRFDADLAGVGP